MRSTEDCFSAPDLPLEAVLRTSELHRRQSRPPDYAEQKSRLTAILREIPESPTAVLRRTVAEALLFCAAHSAGVSVLVDDVDGLAFSRHAIVGPWARYTQSRAPRDFSPYDVVVKRRAPQLFQRPGRYYRYLATVEPAVFELLLAPFDAPNRAVGAVWVMLHDDTRRFEAEDARRLISLSSCAAAAYQISASLASITDRAGPPLSLAGDLMRLHTALESTNVPQQKPSSSTERALSRRERQVSLFVAQGHTNAAIAAALGLNAKTVATYRSRVTDKLGFRNRADFVTYAVMQGWLQQR